MNFLYFLSGIVVASLISGAITTIVFLRQEKRRQWEVLQKQKDKRKEILVVRIVDTDWGIDARKAAYKEYLYLGGNGSIAARYGKELA